MADADGVWGLLSDAVNPVLDRPRALSNLVAQRLTTSRGSDYFIVKNPVARTYVHLAPDERFVLELMDGSRPVKDLILAYFQEYRRLAPRRILHLVAELRQHGFLVETPGDLWQDLSTRMRRGSWEVWLDAAVRGFTNREIAISGVDRFATALHNAFGRLLFTVLGASLLVLIGGLGFALFLGELLLNGRNPFTIAGSTGLGAVTILILSLLLVGVHEMGHAMAVKSFGREVNRGGFVMYYGMPAFFVDTSDIWMEPRGPRMVVSVAGPLVTWAVGGLAMLYVVLAPESFWLQVAYQVALISFVNNTLNVMPLLELDGYYLLMDWLELPLLRARALSFVRHDLLGKLHRRDPFNREERILAIYGGLAFAGTVAILAFAILFWLARGREMAGEILATTSWPIAILAAFIVAVVTVPLVLGFVAKLQRLLRRASVSDYIRAWRASQSVRLRLDAREILERQRFLQKLESREREAIVQRLKPRRIGAGSYVVREGQPGNEFFLIRSGQAEVLRLEDGWPRRLVILGRGDSFGELALLDERPRQASVRALTTLEVFVLDGEKFRSVIGPELRRYGLTRQRLDDRAEISRVAIFAQTAPSDLDPILDRLTTEDYPAGIDIVREGETGDRFYVVRRGRLDVLTAGPSGEEAKVAELGPGDYFGEMALINDAPRSATIRSCEDVALWSLDRSAFQELVMAQGRRGEQIKTEASRRRSALQRLAPAH